MMINKRLIGSVKESKKYIAGNVICQWISLVANIVMMTSITSLLAALVTQTADTSKIFVTLFTAIAAVLIRFFCTTLSAKWDICLPKP